MVSNLQRLRERMSQQKIEVLLVTDIINVRWLTGFTGSFGQALVTLDEAFFITDTRYVLQSQKEVSGFELIWFNRPKTALEIVKDLLKRLKVTRLAFESTMSYDMWSSYGAELKPIHMVPDPGILTSLRMIKTPEEIEKIKRACGLADECIKHVERMIQPGIRELDISLDIEFFIRRNNATPSFNPIVASGEHSASPHSPLSTRVLQRGDFVTIDWGAFLDGYCSDMTRTYILGEPTAEQCRVYSAVLEAQLMAISSIRPGISAQEPDRVAREVLAGYDLGNFFIHGLGHGLGREVHDFGSLNVSSSDILEVGQVWTVEPGVYIEGFGGVRIEDDLVITEQGVEILTHYPKALADMVK